MTNENKPEFVSATENISTNPGEGIENNQSQNEWENAFDLNTPANGTGVETYTEKIRKQERHVKQYGTEVDPFGNDFVEHVKSLVDEHKETY